ncbi:TetR/AcrR family transcriptional regulator [Actinophytocola glycyrrhizae]|uniref:TetR/AcrR family transcriptional regulator n=1 Tax=Actinophytocola glycyrrhizae TaxID=2044873 RepID=A0ABV9SGN6_9PSEU
MDATAVQPTSRPGGRTARNRVAVRDATLAELAAHGYAGLTVEAVATRSGVHKTTVYRRWGGVDGLVVDALALADEDEWAPPDTGSFAADLRALAREVMTTFADSPASAAFVAAAFQSARAAAALHGFYAQRHRRAEVVVTRAVTRGEVPAGTDAGAVVKAAVAPFYYRVLIAGETPSEEVADQSAAAVAHAAQAGLYA